MLIIAHRGQSDGYVENSIDSLLFLPPGFDGVEIDVRITSDRVPILMHDLTVDRITDGHGQVEAHTLKEIQSLSLGNDTKVPTLEAYLDACNFLGFKHILLDIKASSKQALSAVEVIVRNATIFNNVICMVKEESAAKTLREIGENIRIGLFRTCHSNVAEHIEIAKRYGVELLLILHGDTAYLANREIIATIKQAGLKAGASVINTYEAYSASVQDGCYLILTDRTDMFKV